MCIILVGCQQFFSKLISIIRLPIYVILVIRLRERFACGRFIEESIDSLGKIGSKESNYDNKNPKPNRESKYLVHSVCISD
jgi:hypothetical protein